MILAAWYLYTPLSLNHSFSVWCIEYGGSDSVGLLRPGHKDILVLALSSLGLRTYGGCQPPCCEDTQTSCREGHMGGTWPLANNQPAMWVSRLGGRSASSMSSMPLPNISCTDTVRRINVYICFKATKFRGNFVIQWWVFNIVVILCMDVSSFI